MLAIRLQRTGRKGHAHYRMVVQDSRFTPTSGRVVAYVGSFDPHTKVSKLDVGKIESFLKNGAQPSGRAIKLLEANQVNLPAWVVKPGQKKRDVRKPEKRRATAPEAPPEAAATVEPAETEAPEAEPTEPTEGAETETATTEAPDGSVVEVEKLSEAEAPTDEPTAKQSAEDTPAEPDETPVPAAEEPS